MPADTERRLELRGKAKFEFAGTNGLSARSYSCAKIFDYCAARTDGRSIQHARRGQKK
ncbi:MAG TPA: hypothetical protein VGK97_11825 [Spongiibacteraceae bacterium]